MLITYETNEYDEQVKVTTLPNGTQIRELDRPLAPVVDRRLISKLGFRRRFTRSEKAAIELAAVIQADAPIEQQQLAAALRADLKDQEAAQFIDLDDPAVVEGVQQLEQFGLIGAGRATEILTAEIADSDHP